MILKNTVCIKVRDTEKEGKKILKKQQSHYHLTPGLMSVAFKVPIWFFLQTGGICEKTTTKKTKKSYNHHYNSKHGVL